MQINSGANNRNFSTTDLLTGDILANEVVDVFDYGQLVTDFGPRMPSSGSNADLDFDGDVDIYDYSFLVGNFGVQGVTP